MRHAPGQAPDGLHLLRLAVLFLELALHRDVAHHAQDRGLPLERERAQRHVDREFGSVLALRRQVESFSHPSRSRLLDVAVTEASVAGTRSGREEVVDGSASQPSGLVPEHVLGLDVREENFSSGVHEEHGVRRRVEQTSEHLFALAQVFRLGRELVAQLLFMGDVASDSVPELGLGIEHGAPEDPTVPTILGAVAVVEGDRVSAADPRHVADRRRSVLGVHELDPRGGQQLLEAPTQRLFPRRIQHLEVAVVAHDGQEIRREIEELLPVGAGETHHGLVGHCPHWSV